MSGTPIANIQTGDLSNEKDVHSFLEYLSADRGMKIGTGINRKLHSFIFDLDQIFLNTKFIFTISKKKFKCFQNTIVVRILKFEIEIS